MNDKTELEICEAATPGPWGIGYSEPTFTRLDIVRDNTIVTGGRDNDLNAAFIAHFNPQRVKELLLENQRFRDESKMLQGQIMAWQLECKCELSELEVRIDHE